MSDPASVLAFILLGLKSAKVAYDILSRYKDGPDEIKKSTADVKSLLLTLERLSKCSALEEQSGEALLAPINACLDDIDSFANKLKGLTAVAQKSRRDKYWKRFRAMWEEKALSKMSARLTNHTNTLNLHLNILQSDAVVGMPGQLESIIGELTAQETARKTAQGTQLAIFNEQTTILGGVKDGVKCLGSSFETMRGEIQTTFSASAASHLENRGLLEQILQHVAKVSLTDQGSSRVVDAQSESAAGSLRDEETHAAKNESCEELMNIITRLCCLVNDTNLQGRVMSGEPKDIIGDLLLTLELMRSEGFLQAGVMSGLINLSICSTCRQRHLNNLRTSLTTVYAALLQTRLVTVNHVDRVQQRASGPYYQSHSTLSSYETSIGTLSVLSRRRSQKCTQLPQLSQTEAPSLAQMEEEVMTSVSLVSGLSQARHAIKVNIRQTHSYNGVFSAIPQLLVYNIRSAGSPVFSIVQQGKLQEFQVLLREGEVSLRDQDEYGASLLFYANEQPEMCRYLIQLGADVDHIASFKGVLDSDAISSAFYTDINYCEAGEQLEPILDCRKRLLEAGCDPTLPILTYSEPDVELFEAFLDVAVPEAIRILLDFGSSFVNASTKNTSGGLSAFAMVCSSGRWSVESLTILLQRNADVTERDDYGQTCLHHCMLSYWLNGCLMFGPSVWIREFSMGIILLIKHGADIYADDHFDISVSHYAYFLSYDRNRLGCVRGDVWDFALASCGYDISDFRRGRRREARYGTHYTRQDFEKLWAGHEHLCPYYDDEEECFSSVGTSSCSEEEDEDEWMTTDSEDAGPDETDLDGE